MPLDAETIGPILVAGVVGGGPENLSDRSFMRPKGAGRYGLRELRKVERIALKLDDRVVDLACRSAGDRIGATAV
jgi:hypothetical protein